MPTSRSRKPSLDEDVVRAQRKLRKLFADPASFEEWVNETRPSTCPEREENDEC